MSLNPRHLLERAIRPALKVLGPGNLSEAAERIVLGTAAVESGLSDLVQRGGGPALSLWQMEPATYRDIWKNYLAYHEDLRVRLLSMTSRSNGEIPDPEEMVWNLRYGAAMCRIHYLRDPFSLPDARNTPEMGKVWKRHYNTRLGKGTVEKYVSAWLRHASSIYG